MTAATAPPPEVAAYLAAVRQALDDLPAPERDDLLAEVEASIVDAASETGAPIAARLGPPDEFAAELRAAAGLQATASAPRESRLVVLARRAAAATAPARAVARELAPVWWVARAYIVVGILVLESDAGWSWRAPVFPRFAPGGFDHPLTGVVVLLAAVAASVWIGFRSRRWTRGKATLAAANVALLLLAVPVLTNFPQTAYSNVTVVEETPIEGLVYNGAAVDNIYPYSRDGRLLHDVFLYDSYGRPIELGSEFEDPLRRVLRTRAGRPVYNSFPIRYYEPGTKRVARPNAGPPVKTPRIATPPLRRNAR